MMPSARERHFTCIFDKAGITQTSRELDVVRIGDDFCDYIDIGRTADWCGGLIRNQQSQCDTANEDDLIQKRSEPVNRFFKQRKIWIRH